MKKGIATLISVLMIIGSILGSLNSIVEATHINVNIDGKVGSYEKAGIEIDGKCIEGDMSAIIYKGSTMVPIKFVADAVGASTDWNDKLRQVTITKDKVVIKAKIGETKATVNGVEKPITGGIGPVLGNNRTLLSIRFIAEELNFKVGWDDDSRSALLVSKDTNLYEVYRENSLIKVFQTKVEAIEHAKKNEGTKILYGNKEVWNKDNDELIEVRIDNTLGYYEKVRLKVDDKSIEGDMPAILYKENTMVPIKFIADAIGAETLWNNNSREATILKLGTVIKVKIGETKATVNGVEKNITGGMGPIIGNERTLLPIRFVAEELGFEVGWNNDTREVLLNSKNVAEEKYEIHQGTIVLKSFGSLNSAITEAEKWTDSTIVYKGKVVWDYNINHKNYSIYKENDFIDTFKNYYDAISKAVKIEGSRINYRGMDVWKYNTYKNGYTVYQGALNLGSFDTKNSAIAEAEKWTDSIIMYSGEKIWSYNDKEDKKLIVVDPGHGGVYGIHPLAETGVKSVSGTHLEKDLTLSVSLKLERELKSRGYDVLMTRCVDESVSIADRVKIANEKRADAFISIHFNSFTTPKATGIETWYASEKSGVDDKLNKKFSSTIQKKLIEETKEVDRGIKEGEKEVIKETKMYSAIVELGFISNPTDEPTLISEKYHNLAAKAIASGIDDFFKGN